MNIVVVITVCQMLFLLNKQQNGNVTMETSNPLSCKRAILKPQGTFDETFWLKHWPKTSSSDFKTKTN